MEKKYSLKLEGRFAGHYEIFTETEVREVRNLLRMIGVNLAKANLFHESELFDKVCDVLFIASPEFQDYYRKHFGIDG